MLEPEVLILLLLYIGVNFCVGSSLVLSGPTCSPWEDCKGKIFWNPSPSGITSANENDLWKVKFYLGSLHALNDQQRDVPSANSEQIRKVLLVPEFTGERRDSYYNYIHPSPVFPLLTFIPSLPLTKSPQIPLMHTCPLMENLHLRAPSPGTFIYGISWL